MRLIGSVALITVMLAINDLTAAQTPTAALTGMIRDSAGSPLPSAEVAVENAVTGYVYRGQANANGRYWLRALPPGHYQITARILGFRALTRQDVTLFVGQTATLDFVLPEAAVQLDPLVVVGEQRLIETTQADVSFVLEREQIDILPEKSRALMDLALLAPGATRTPGAPDGVPPNGIGAMNPYYVGVQLDGTNLVGGEYNEYTGSVPLLAIQEFEVLTSSYSAEFGQAASGLVNAVSRKGSNELNVEAFGLLRHRSINSLGHFEDTKPDFNRSHWGIAMSGPIRRDRTHFFLAAERKVKNTFATVETGGVWPQYEGTFKTPFKDNLLFARIDHRLSETHELTFRYAGDISDARNAIGGSSAEEHGIERRKSLHSVLVAHRATLGSALNELRLHVMRQGDLMERINDGPQLVYPSLVRGGNMSSWDIVNYRIELKEKLSFVAAGPTGTHRITTGAQASLVDVDDFSALWVNGEFGYRDDADTEPSWALIAFDPISIRETNVQLGAFLEDEWSPVPNLTLNLGFRYDIETNGSNQGYVSPEAGSLDFVRSTPRPIDKNNVAPRLGIAWDPSGDGHTVVRGGFGIFYHQNFVAYGGEESRVRIAYVANPGTTNLSELGIDPETLRDVAPTYVARDVQTPFTRQVSAGVEHSFPSSVTLGLDAIYIQGRNLWVARKVGAMRYWQQLNAGESEAKMLVLHVTKQFMRGSVELHYTLADRKATTDWWIEDVPITDPNVEDFSSELGPVEWDERHRLVVIAAAHMPFDFDVGLKGIYSSARPYNAITGTDDNNDGSLNDRPPGEGRNARRGPNYFNVDLGLSRMFTLRGAQVAIVANVYNLFSRTNFDPKSVNGDLQSDLFGEPLQAFAKRQAEVGLRVEF